MANRSNPGLGRSRLACSSLKSAKLIGSQAADCIRASGHGPREQAGHMTAPDRGAERHFTLASREPSTQDAVSCICSQNQATPRRVKRYFSAYDSPPPRQLRLEFGEPAVIDARRAPPAAPIPAILAGTAGLSRLVPTCHGISGRSEGRRWRNPSNGGASSRRCQLDGLGAP